MNSNTLKYGMIAALAGLAGCGEVNATEVKGAAKGTPATTTKETVVKNDDGSVTKTKTETREIKDAAGNVIGHETSTYSETTFEKGASEEANDAAETVKGEPAESVATDSFLGLKFGETPEGADKAEEVAGEPALKVIKFTPAKKLEGFDDYFAYVTPKTHKLVKVVACARKRIESVEYNRRHYLVEALENRYRVWARLASWVRPLYVLDVAPQRGVSICLSGASDDYETVISAWDDEAARLAKSELREMRDAAYKEAVEKRNQRIKEAESVF